MVEANCTFWDGQHDMYVEMPWYGNTLARWMEAPRSLEAKRAVLQQLLMALQHVHAHDIVRCDVKPDNIFMLHSEPAHIKLGDFDISLDKARTLHACLGPIRRCTLPVA